MNGWLLDTNVVSELRKAHPDRRVKAWSDAQAPNATFMIEKQESLRNRNLETHGVDCTSGKLLIRIRGNSKQKKSSSSLTGEGTDGVAYIVLPLAHWITSAISDAISAIVCVAVLRASLSASDGL